MTKKNLALPGPQNWTKPSLVTKKPPLTNAEKQARFRQKQLAKGLHRVSIWLNINDFCAGWDASAAGDRTGYPSTADPLSWLSGFCTHSKGGKPPKQLMPLLWKLYPDKPQ